MSYSATNKYAAEFLRGMVISDLRELLTGAQQKFFELHSQCLRAGRKKQAEKPHLFNKIKRDIARFKTILKEVQF